MLGPFARNEIGVVGPKLLFEDETVQHAGVIINKIGPCHINYRLPRYSPGYFNTAILPMDLSAVTGACLMTSRSLYDYVGGFDESLATNYNDVDFCLKIRKANKQVLFNPFVELYHFEGMSREKEENTSKGRVDMTKALSLLMTRYPEYFANGDPFYNHNFAENSTNFSI